MGMYACPCCMLVFKKNNVLTNGSVNLKHELYMYVYAERNLLIILLLMILTDEMMLLLMIMLI